MTPKNGFIYIMSNPDFNDGLIKIGKSKSDPGSFRKDELYSTGVPSPFKIEYVAYVENYDFVEMQVHNKLSDKRPNKQREFFKSSINEAVDTIREISNIKYEEVFFQEFPLDEIEEKFWSNSKTLYSRKCRVTGPGHGFLERFWSNGQLEERINYKNGEKHGTSEYFDRHGNKKWKKTYRNGTLNGLWEYYRANGRQQTCKLEENGLKVRGNYKDGGCDGLWEWFFEDGQIERRGNYKLFPSSLAYYAETRSHYEGKENGLWEWFFENGQIKIRANYKDGKENGLWEEFYEHGQLKIRANYKDGKENGLCEEFYEDGTLESRINYKDGFYDGLYEEFDEHGNLTHDNYF